MDNRDTPYAGQSTDTQSGASNVWVIPHSIPGLAPAEVPVYHRTAQILAESLDIASRTPNLVTKLKRLDLAAQKCEDLLWLAPTYETDRLERLSEAVHSDIVETLEKLAVPEIDRQLTRAEKTKSDTARASALRKAGALLAYCSEDIGDSAQVRDLEKRLYALGAEMVPRETPASLSDRCRRPSAVSPRKAAPVKSGGVGCLFAVAQVLSGLLRWGR